MGIRHKGSDRKQLDRGYQVVLPNLQQCCLRRCLNLAHIFYFGKGKRMLHANFTHLSFGSNIHEIPEEMS